MGYEFSLKRGLKLFSLYIFLNSVNHHRFIPWWWEPHKDKCTLSYVQKCETFTTHWTKAVSVTSILTLLNCIHKNRMGKHGWKELIHLLIYFRMISPVIPVICIDWLKHSNSNEISVLILIVLPPHTLPIRCVDVSIYVQHIHYINVTLYIQCINCIC